jgi:hypothetical protein
VRDSTDRADPIRRGLEAAFLQPEDLDETGDLEDAAGFGGRGAQDQVPASTPGELEGVYEDADPGRVHEGQTGEVDDQLGVPVIEGGVQALAQHRGGLQVKLAVEAEDTGVAIRGLLDGEHNVADVAHASNLAARPSESETDNCLLPLGPNLRGKKEAGMPGEVAVDDNNRPNRAAGRLRVSDAERRAVVDALRLHTGDGRLGIDEFEERSEMALAAKTRDDLKGLLDDLPFEPGLDSPATTWAGAVPAPDAVSTPRAQQGAIAGQDATAGQDRAPHRHAYGGWYLNGWNDFVFISLLLTAIWWMTGAGYFWPMWVIVPTGLGVLCRGGRVSRRRVGATPSGAP